MIRRPLISTGSSPARIATEVESAEHSPLSPLRVVLVTLAIFFAQYAHAAPPADSRQAALDLLTASIGYRTVEGAGQVPVYARFLADRLVTAGYAPADVVIEPLGDTATLVATWPGSDPALKPIVVSDHMDVVAADPKDWTRDPFKAVVENGYVYGRGAEDIKFDVAMVVTALGDLKRAGYRPKRTIILALSGDEETHMLTARRLARQLKGAELVLNGDAGGGVLAEATGKPARFNFQAGEKSYVDFEIAFTDPGGHSSQPRPDNAIYRLARTIDRIAAYKFPPQPNPLTIARFKVAAATTPGPLGALLGRYAANPQDVALADELSQYYEWIGQIRTTCVATMISGGHALNALPQRAAVNVNCRIMPGVPLATVRAALEKVVDDPRAIFTTLDDPTASDPSPLRPDVTAAIEKAVHAWAPGVPVVPSMDAGASDSVHFRAAGIPSYGVSSLFIKDSDDFAHGLNERSPVASIPGALVQWRVLLTELSSK